MYLTCTISYCVNLYLNLQSVNKFNSIRQLGFFPWEKNAKVKKVHDVICCKNTTWRCLLFRLTLKADCKYISNM
jgi:hypothetical protein